jgi:hypothetical protein
MEWKHPNHYKKLSALRKQEEKRLAEEAKDIAIGKRIKVKDLSSPIKNLLDV